MTRSKKKLQKLVTVSLLGLTLTSTGLASINQGKIANAAETTPVTVDSQMLKVTNFTLDKSCYQPNQKASFKLTIANPLSNTAQWGTYEVTYYSPVSGVHSLTSGKWKVAENGTEDIDCSFNVPVKQGGYILNVTFYTDTHKPIATFNNGLDVDSNWLLHPRYAALTNFSEKSQNKSDNLSLDINTLTQKYHMNSAMFYDAYFRPQNPIPADMDSFTDWHNDVISKNLLKEGINDLHNNNSKVMLYNMCNAVSGFPGNPHAALDDGSWSVIDKDGKKYLVGKDGLFYPNSDIMVNSVMGDNRDTQVQWYTDPANPHWQNYIIPRMNNTLNYMDFDGWQGDTPGKIVGTTYDNRGTDKTIDDSEFYYYFVDAAKKQMSPDKEFGINAVNAAGQHNIATKSKKEDFDYTELWSSSFPNYYDLAKVIEQNWQDDDKPLITPVYFMSGWREKDEGSMPKHYNDNAVRQMTATIMANGGSPMILADNGYLLDNEYYNWERMQRNDDGSPKSISMDDALGNANNGYLRHYFDFQTSYEDLLQDPTLQLKDNYIQIWDGGAVNKGNWVNRNDAEANTVYAFSKTNHKIDTLNLVNLMGTTNKWQVDNADDNNNHNVKPQTNLAVKYYPTTDNIKHVYLSSPDDPYDSTRVELPFTSHKDDSGHTYLEFTIPKLDVWDLVYMTPDDSANSSSTTSSSSSNSASHSSTDSSTAASNKPATTTDSNNHTETKPAASSNKPAETDKPSSDSKPATNATVTKPDNSAKTSEATKPVTATSTAKPQDKPTTVTSNSSATTGTSDKSETKPAKSDSTKSTTANHPAETKPAQLNSSGSKTDQNKNDAGNQKASSSNKSAIKPDDSADKQNDTTNKKSDSSTAKTETNKHNDNIKASSISDKKDEADKSTGKHQAAINKASKSTVKNKESTLSAANKYLSQSSVKAQATSDKSSLTNKRSGQADSISVKSESAVVKSGQSKMNSISPSTTSTSKLDDKDLNSVSATAKNDSSVSNSDQSNVADKETAKQSTDKVKEQSSSSSVAAKVAPAKTAVGDNNGQTNEPGNETSTTETETAQNLPSDSNSDQLAKTNARANQGGLLAVIGTVIGIVAGWFGLKKNND